MDRDQERNPTDDELREEDVRVGDRLDDRVAEDTVHSEADDLLPPADAPINTQD